MDEEESCSCTTTESLRSDGKENISCSCTLSGTSYSEDVSKDTIERADIPSCSCATPGSSYKGSLKSDSKRPEKGDYYESCTCTLSGGSYKGSTRSDSRRTEVEFEDLKSCSCGTSYRGSMKSDAKKADIESCSCTTSGSSYKGSLKSDDTRTEKGDFQLESCTCTLAGSSYKGSFKEGRRFDDCSCSFQGSSYKGSVRSEGRREDDSCTCTLGGNSYKGSIKSDGKRPETIPEVEPTQGLPPIFLEGSQKSDAKEPEVEPTQGLPPIFLEGSRKSSLKSDSKKSEDASEGDAKKDTESCVCTLGSYKGGSKGDAKKPEATPEGDAAASGTTDSSSTGGTSGGTSTKGSSSKGSDPKKPDDIKSAERSCSTKSTLVSGSAGSPSILDPNSDPANPKMLTYDMIRAARKNVEGAVLKTPLTKSKLSELYGMNVYLKAEFLQYTGSFKERGARNALVNMPEGQKHAGAVSASAGNHALALCFHGQQLGIPVTVVMPTTAPIMKVQNCREFGAEIVVKGNDLSEAKSIAQKIAKDKGALYINGYDHIDVLAGQGTIGIEVLEQLPTATAVLVPTGGGGLIAGVAVAIKTLKPCTKVIGVESENCPSFSNSLKAGKPVMTTTLPTISDGLAVPLPGYNSVFTAKSYVDKMIVVKEDDIAVAMLRLIEKEKFIVEGAGATAVAAIASGQLDEFKGKNVVAILSGGNIDSTVLGRVLERGLAADGRFLKVYVTVSDRPGGVAELIKLISSIGVSIKLVSQERKWLIVDVFSVMVKVVCETRDWDHALELKHLLQDHYKNVNMVHVDFPASTISGKEEI